MNRQHLMLLLPLLIAAVFTLSQPVQADDRKADGEKADPKHLHHGPHMECAKACDDCARSCEACGAHCAQLVAEGKKEHLHTLRTCQDCATFCSAASGITARKGPFIDLICTACAESCKRCGDACQKHESDPMMAQCAAECRKCEKACREMIKHAGHEHHESK